jgi:hypothetical protein
MTDARYIRITLFCEKTGYTDRAVRRKIQEGVWQEGREFRRTPDRNILIDLNAYKKWVNRGSE